MQLTVTQLMQASIFVLSMCRHMIRAIEHMLAHHIRAIDVSINVVLLNSICRQMIRAIDAFFLWLINLCTNSDFGMISLKSRIRALNVC